MRISRRPRSVASSSQAFRRKDTKPCQESGSVSAFSARPTSASIRSSNSASTSDSLSGNRR